MKHFKSLAFLIFFAIAVIYLIGALSGCAGTPSGDWSKISTGVGEVVSPKPATSPTPVPALPPPPLKQKKVSLAWGHDDWTATLLTEIAASFNKFDSAKDDMVRFCPKYKELASEDKVVVWGTLAVAIAKFESGYNPKSAMTESDGSVSQGLFQLTYGNSHCPKHKSDGDLNDPAINIRCAVAIMADDVGEDHVVTAGGYTKYGAPPAKGAGRYWSVLRVVDSHSKHHLADLMAMTALAPGCR